MKRKQKRYDDMFRHPEIREILASEDFQRLGLYTHHGRVTRKDHCLAVAGMVYAMARRRRLDYISATRAALLHDFFFYNWRTEGPRLHGLRHPALAFENARTRFTLNSIEEDAIVRHMWPLTPRPPRYAESYLVCMADKAVALGDYSRFLRIPRRRRAALGVINYH
ncbi:MAG: hypothetical protein EPN93_00030 [Spirochaetes bacterium]|nr:MAG: hypothetical protein EPN93_00030 [Spirochaetota bacterium]